MHDSNHESCPGVVDDRLNCWSKRQISKRCDVDDAVESIDMVVLGDRLQYHSCGKKNDGSVSSSKCTICLYL